MGANFQVDVNVVTHGAEQVDALEKRLNALQSKGVDLKVKVDGLDKLDTTKIGKQFTLAGQQASKNFASKFKNIKIDNAQLFDYAKERKNVDALTKDAQKKIVQNVDGISKSKAGSFAKSYINEQIKQNAQVERQLQRSAEKQAKAYESVQKRINSGEFEARNAKADKFLSKYDGQNSEVLEKARKTVSEIKSLQSELQSGVYSSGDKKGLKIVDSDQIKIMDQIDEKAKQMKNTFTEISNLESKTLGQGIAERSANSVATYMESNTKALKKYGEQLAILQQQYKSATTEFEKSDLDNQFKNLKSRISAEGLTGRSGWDEFKRAGKQIAQFAGIYGAIQNIGMEIPSQMISAVKDYDSAMVNMQMATGISNDQAKELMNTYSDMGKQLKATGVDVATSATEWMKQGKSIQESNKLAQDSIVLSKIGDLSSDDATRTITAAMKSYDLNESQVMDFIDQISAIDMASATDVGGLADAFNEVAANANQAGISTKQLLSYAAVIGETTQEGMSSVGTSLNAIFSRMGNIKLARLKDYQNGGEDLSNVETVLKGVGISLRDADGEFKNFGDVLDETAEKYASFGTVEQRAVAQAFAGTNHMNDFMVLMQQYSKAQEYMQMADDASGSSMEKYSAYTDSLEGKLEGLKSTFESLGNTVVSSDFLKGSIDTGTKFIEVIDKITSSFGLLNTAAVGLGIFQGKNNSGKSTWDSPYAFFKMTYAA